MLEYIGNAEEVLIPNGIVAIASQAFNGNRKIKKVTLPQSVTRMEKNAFSACEFLSNIVFSQTLEYIGSCAFYNCSSLKNIEIPQSVTEIDRAAFCKCYQLESIHLPCGMKKISDKLFDSCSRLKEVILPNSVAEIGADAFSFCSSLTYITIPDHVKILGKRVFSYCNGLEKITLPDGVTHMEEGLFSSCHSLTELIIPSTVTKIAERVFAQCISLKNLIIPQSVQIVEACAFSDLGKNTNILFKGKKASDALSWNAEWKKKCKANMIWELEPKKAIKTKPTTKQKAQIPANDCPEAATRLECQKNGSFVFWEILVDGNYHTVHFGIIGTKGDSKTVQFGSESEAQADKDRLIASKIQSGYKRVEGFKQNEKAYKKRERITDQEELAEHLENTLLLEAVSEHITSLKELPNIIGADTDEDTISSITYCELLDCGAIELKEKTKEGNKLNLSFKLPVILTAWKKKKQVLRITTCVVCECQVPNANTLCWDMDFSKMTRSELLQYIHLVHFTNVCYEETEYEEEFGKY